MITKLVVRNYRGLAALTVEPSAAGTVASGRNTAGKTSVLTALRAALAAQDIGSDAIRHGADSAEILVDLDDVSVRRAITRNGTTLKVTQGGFEPKKPQHFLTELLGLSPLDPLDLLLLKPRERRARILEALPCTVTRAELTRWAPDLPAGFPIPEGEHGLVTVDRLRTWYYDRRTAANATAKESLRRSTEASEACGAAEPPTAPLDVAECTQALEAAKRERERLTLRAEEVARAEEWATKARGDVEAKNLEAARLRETAPETVDAGPLEEEATRRAKAVVRLRAELAEAEAHAFQSAGALSEALRVNRERERTFQAASEREAFADALHAQLGVMPAAVTQAEVNGAQASVTAANVLLAQAKGQEALRKQLADAAALRAVAEADAALAAKLDGVVIDLTNEAPKSLAMVDAIPGLALNGERVTLDGKDLDALSGREQMALCVAIAKRANAKSRLIVVDGLERVDVETRDAFIAEATSGGFQLFATVVTGGELQIHSV